MITIKFSNQSTDANNGMIDVLGELISNFESHFIIGFAVMPVCSSKSLDIRNSLDIPHYDVIQERPLILLRRVDYSCSLPLPIPANLLTPNQARSVPVPEQ